MKKLPPLLRLFLWALIGCTAGTGIGFILISKIPGTPGGNICFFAGMTVLILGLFTGLKGNPRHNTVGFADGGYFGVYALIDEEKTTKAMEKHFRENHVLMINPLGVGLVFAGILMAVMAHLSLVGRI